MQHSADFDWDALSQAELEQACHRLTLGVSPALSKETLTKILLGDLPYNPSVHGSPIDDIRNRLMGFILKYWNRIQSQLTCPAKSGEPDSCYQCVDAQVLTCLVQNERHEQLILATPPLVQIRRNKETTMTTKQALTVATAPRDYEKLKTESPSNLREVLKELGAYKPAFNMMNTDDKAKVTYEALIAHDKYMGGGAPAAAPTNPVVATPAAASVADAPVAATPEVATTGRGRRSPRAAAAEAPAAAPPAAAPAPASAPAGDAVAAQVQALVQAMTNFSASINALVSASAENGKKLDTLVTAITGKEGLNANMNEALQLLDNQGQALLLTTTITAMASAEGLGTDVPSLLQDAVETMASAEEVINKALAKSGKG